MSSANSQEKDIFCFLTKTLKEEDTCLKVPLDDINGVRFMLDTSGKLLRVIVSMKSQQKLSRKSRVYILNLLKKENYRKYMPTYLRREDLSILKSGDVVYYISVKYSRNLTNRCGQ